MNSLALKSLMQHEGFSEKIYVDSTGNKTIGYGYNLDANPLRLSDYTLQKLISAGINKAAAHELLEQQCANIERELINKILWWSKLSYVRQAVFINMSYNLGVNGMLGFTKMMSAASVGRYTDAAIEMLNSRWATQVKGRSIELAYMMHSGLRVFSE